MIIGSGITIGSGVRIILPSVSGFSTTNLLLYLNATNSSSYSGSGTAWNDLSGNSNNGTLVGSPTYTASPGYFTFGANKYTSTGLISSAFTAATFIAWVYPTQTQSQYTGVIFNRSGYGSASAYATGMNFYTSNSVGYHWNDNGATYGWNSSLTVPNNAWSMIAVTVNSTTATAYLCQSSGITTATNTSSHASTLSGLSFYIACDPANTGGRAFVGNISQGAVYNTTLTSDEITTNFNNTKSIYGL